MVQSDHFATQIPTLSTLDSIAIRHSVRSFRPEPVPEEIIVQLLDAARQAPSSWNLQPWEFIVVTEHEAKEALVPAVAEWNRTIVRTAGATIVCLGSMRQQDALADQLEQQWLAVPDRTEERLERVRNRVRRLREDHAWRREHVLNNTYIGIAHLVLAATAFGLGTVWMGGFTADDVKQVMGIPDDFLVASLVSVGWPTEPLQAEPRKRRQVEEIYHKNRF